MTLNLRAAWLLFFLFFMQASIADSHQQLPLSYAPLNSAFEPQQAASLEFHRYISGFRLPFAQNPHGIVLRMEMPALAESPGDYNLVLHPQYLAEATLWLKQQGDPRWISEKRGRLLPGKPSYYSPQTLVYELPKKLDDSSFLYLVVRDRGVPKPVSINLVNRKTFLESDVRCQPWRAKRRLVDPSSREAALFSRRALRQRENKVGLRTRRPVIGSQVRSSNELAKLLRSAW